MGNEAFEPDLPQRRTPRGKKSEKPKKSEEVPETSLQVPPSVELPLLTEISNEQRTEIRKAIMESFHKAYAEFARTLPKPQAVLNIDEEVPPPPPPPLPPPRLPVEIIIPQNDYRLSSAEEKQLREVENNPTYKKILNEVEKRLPAHINDKRFMAQMAELFFKTRDNGLQTVALENLGLREVPEEKVDLAVRDKIAMALGAAKTPPYRLIFVESNVPGTNFVSQLQSIEDFILVNYEWAKKVSPQHLAAASFHEKQHHVPDRFDLYRNMLLSIIADERGLKDEDKAMLIALGEMAHDKKTVQDLQGQHQGKGLIMLLDFFLQSLMMIKDPGPSFKIRINALKREIARLSLASK